MLVELFAEQVLGAFRQRLQKHKATYAGDEAHEEVVARVIGEEAEVNWEDHGRQDLNR